MLKRFQTSLRFSLDLRPAAHGAQVPWQLRVDERDRIIAVATTNTEVAHVGGDDFGFRENLRQTDNPCVSEIHLLTVFSDESGECDTLGFGDGE